MGDSNSTRPHVVDYWGGCPTWRLQRWLRDRRVVVRKCEQGGHPRVRLSARRIGYRLSVCAPRGAYRAAGRMRMSHRVPSQAAPRSGFSEDAGLFLQCMPRLPRREEQA
jgi:hypothetical protein